MKSTIEKLDTARRRVLNAASMVNQYKGSWGVDFCFKELDMGLTNKKGFGWESIPVITQAELKELGRDTLYQYGFGNWDGKLLMVPLWLVNFLDQDEEVVSIMNNKSTLAECDKDTRGGCLAFGFFL